MTKIFRVAKLELQILFYSPIAWVVLIIFMIQGGMALADSLFAEETSQQLAYELSNLTNKIFAGKLGFFSTILRKIYLYIPLLTMGIISREISSGSIKLIQSSPVTNLQVVLGKYLALLLYGFGFIVILGGLVLTAGLAVDHMDYGYMVSALLGIYLLIAAYSAIGLLMSSLTSYQIVAAISTLAVLAALNYVGMLAQGNEVLREVTYWLSLAGRTDHFINGMISSKDALYFILVIIMFVGLTVMKMGEGRVVRSSATQILRYVAFIGIVVVAGYVSSIPQFSKFLDLSRFQANTLTSNSKAVISQLDQPVHMTTYANILHPHGRLATLKWRKFDEKQFEQLTRFIPSMTNSYVLYYDHVPVYADSTVNILEKAQKAALALGLDFSQVLSPEELKRVVDLKQETTGFVRFVHHGQDSVPLRMFTDAQAYPSESEIASALKLFVKPSPVIGFLTGHDERSPSKLGDKSYNKVLLELTNRKALINQGFTIRELTLQELERGNTNLAVLVIADPYQAFTEREQAIVKQYIQEGGNICLMSEPGKAHLINPLLADLPVKIEDGQVYQLSKDLDLDLVQATPPKAMVDKFGFSKKKKSIIALSGATSIAVAPLLGDYHYEPILLSNATSSWKDKVDIAAMDAQHLPASLPHSSSVMAAVLTKAKQKIMVVGDADIWSNGELSRNNLNTQNGEFATQLFKWFSDGEFPVDITRPAPLDNKILVERTHIEYMKYAWAGALPLLLGIIGALLLIKRKQK